MDPLAQLKDIHLPKAVSAWPPSLAWWLALGLSIIALISLGYALYQYRLRGRLTRQALVQLSQLQQQSCTVNELHLLLKQLCLAAFSRSEVASLHGPAWLAFLDQQASRSSRPFSQFTDASVSWTQAQYSAAPAALASQQHFDTCQLWLRKTRLQPVSVQQGSFSQRATSRGARSHV